MTINPNPRFTAENGQGLVEYALIVTAVALVTVAALGLMGVSVAEVYCKVVTTFSDSGPCSEGCRDDFASMDAWAVDRGAWAVENGQLCNTPGREERIVSTCSQSLPTSDYSINLEDAVLSQGPGYSVWFRSSVDERGRRSGYTFQYDPGMGGGGAFTFRKWNNGYPSRPFAATYYRRDVDPNFQWHNISRNMQVVVEGNQFKVLMDGEVVLEGVDDTYPEGEIGLRTWKGGWRDGSQLCLSEFSIDPLWP